MIVGGDTSRIHAVKNKLEGCIRIPNKDVVLRDNRHVVRSANELNMKGLIYL